MLRDTEIEALRDGRFALDCLRIVLRQRVDTAPALYQGSGVISQRPDGSLQVRLLDPDATPRAPTAGTPGELVPDEEYFTLDAVDLEGRAWTANWALPHVIWANGRNGAVVEAALPEIETTDEVLGLRFLTEVTAHVFDALPLPATAYTETEVRTASTRVSKTELNAAQFTAHEFSYECHFAEGHTLLRARGTADKCPPYLPIRLTEALQFVTGREVQIGVIRIVDGGVDRTLVRGGRAGVPRQQFFPPIVDPAERLVHAADVYRLLDDYLRYVAKYPDNEFHPISSEWDAVIRSSAASLDTQSLILSVAAEALLKSVPASMGAAPQTSEDELLREWASRTLAWLKEQSPPDPIWTRIEGSFARFGQPSAMQRLKALADEGLVSAHLPKSWNLLRNARAHGSKGKLKTPDAVVRTRDEVSALLYQLVFLIIGYRGLFTDYGSEGWPTRTFSLDESADMARAQQLAAERAAADAVAEEALGEADPREPLLSDEAAVVRECTGPSAGDTSSRPDESR